MRLYQCRCLNCILFITGGGEFPDSPLPFRLLLGVKKLVCVVIMRRTTNLWVTSGFVCLARFGGIDTVKQKGGRVATKLIVTLQWRINSCIKSNRSIRNCKNDPIDCASYLLPSTYDGTELMQLDANKDRATLNHVRSKP